MEIISLENLSIGYGSKNIIKDINISIKKNEIIYIIGENGVGKTTLVKTLLNLIKPLKGKISYKEVSSNEIGYLPQISTSIRNFPASVIEICMSGAVDKKNKNTLEVAEKILSDLNILDLKNKSFKELSGGQQRRVLLSRCLISSSKVIVMDEPITGLDPLASKDFYNLINKINKELNLTIIIVTHDIKSAVKYADKILHLSENHYCYGDVKTYKKNMLSELFLEEN